MRSMDGNASVVAVLGFLQRYTEDHKAGRERTLEDYQALFPGHERVIAAKYAELLEVSAEDVRSSPWRTGTGPQRIGRFQILEEIGRGGQGLVYLAEDPELHRRVALKVLATGFSLTPDAQRRFQREAEVTSRLKHPGICPVYEAGHSDGIAYIAMQYVEGETLAAKISAAKAQAALMPNLDSAASRTPSSQTRSRPSEVFVVVHLIERVARAAHVAHEAGIVHRDLKPANIRITPDGDPVILDFGLARDEASEEPSLTHSGDVFGTPAYMSPEQLLGERTKIDRRVDVYSLGATLYECLTLRRPFEAPTREALYRSILNDPPSSVRLLNARVPRDLAVVLETALQKNPDHRYATALELAEELRRVREHEPIRTRPAGPLLRLARWSQRNPRLAAALAGLFFVLTGGLAVTGFLLGRTRTILANFDSLALVHRLEEAEAALERIYPVTQEGIPAMEAWLRDQWQPIEEGWPGLRATLTALKTAELEGADRFLFDTLEKLDLRLTEFQRARASRVADDIVWARTEAEETVTKHADEWRTAIAAVAASPLYPGLELPRQVGLIPLGPDPDSGLFEFYHPRSGEPGSLLPKRDPGTNRIVMTGDTGIVFVLLAGGKALVGAQIEDPDAPNYDPEARREEREQRTALLEPFFLSKFELTKGQFERLTGEDDPSEFEAGARPFGGPIVTRANPIDRVPPAKFVSPLDEWHFVTRWGLDLPAEEEWEHACRAGTTTPWYTGETPASLAGYENLGDPSASVVADWYSGDPLPPDGHVVHAPVGSFAPNAFGLHDMHGNVMEICRIWALDDYKGTYAWRGGTFRTNARSAKSTARKLGHGPDHGTGLRLSREIRPELFVEVRAPRWPEPSGVSKTASGDIDGDGAPDMFLVGTNTSPLLNGGGGSFVECTRERFPTPDQAMQDGALCDVDGDGDLDLVCLPGTGIGDSRQGQNRLYINESGGRFHDATTTRMPPLLDSSTCVALGDIDGDGDADMLIGNTGDDNGERNRVYLNIGGGRFQDVTVTHYPFPPAKQSTEDRTQDLVLGDLDGDGDLDLACGNIHYTWQDRVFMNDGSGRFTDDTDRCLPYIHYDREVGDPQRHGDITLSVALGDIDGDADLDLVCGNGWGVRGQINRLYENDGTGRFTDVTPPCFLERAEATEAVAFGDIDGDQDLDLICGNNKPRSRLYMNDGAGNFREVTATMLPRVQCGTALEIVDVDLDQDLDLLIGGKRLRLFLNRTR